MECTYEAALLGGEARGGACSGAGRFRERGRAEEYHDLDAFAPGGRALGLCARREREHAQQPADEGKPSLHVQ